METKLKKSTPISFLVTLGLAMLLLLQPSCKWLSSLFQSEDSELAIIQTPHGKIAIKFFPDVAPKHVESFKKLTKEGFYNGTTFHRVIPGFMIQGGDPLSKDPTKREQHGRGGPGYSIPAEFSERKHTRGVVSAARSSDPDSAGSQFFIMLASAPHLDGQYSIFGQIVSGMDVVDKIVAEERDKADNPLKPMTMSISIADSKNPKVHKELE